MFNLLTTDGGDNALLPRHFWHCEARNTLMRGVIFNRLSNIAIFLEIYRKICMKFIVGKY
jgi:hypothetical protein